METTHTPKFKPEARLVFTITETANALGISRAFAYELVRKGELPSIRLGRRIVVPKLQLAKLVGVDADPDAGGEPDEAEAEVGTRLNARGVA